MKAIIYHQYGSPDVLKLEQVEKPVPKDNEVLIRVQAVAINPYDWHIMRGKPFLVKLSTGLFKPKHKILGSDVSGYVEVLGKNVTQFKPGDAVFGASKFGALAQYVCADEKMLALKPANSTFAEASTLPIAGITALQSIRNDGRNLSGKKVLINGASGGVGTFAVQIAKSFGAEVTGVCSYRNLEMVRSIGADRVIDYTKENVINSGLNYDLVIDAIGNLSVSDYSSLLNVTGVCMVIGFTSMSQILEIMLKGRLSKHKISFVTPQFNRENFDYLKNLVETGKVKPVLDRQYSLAETTAAMTYLEEGHARGKVVVVIHDN